MSEEKSIYKKLLKITEEAEQIPKNGWNEFSKYKYVKAVDALGEIRKLLVKHGVHLTISENGIKRYRDGKNFHTEIDAKATFIDIETGDYHTTTFFSVSADTLDKDIFKAKTNGLKYLFTQEFKLVTDDFVDTEQNGKHKEPEQKISDTQLDTINKLAIETSTDTKGFMDYISKTFNVKEMKNLSYLAGESLIANLNAKLDKQNANN